MEVRRGLGPCQLETWGQLGEKCRAQTPETGIPGEGCGHCTASRTGSGFSGGAGVTCGYPGHCLLQPLPEPGPWEPQSTSIIKLQSIKAERVLRGTARVFSPCAGAELGDHRTGSTLHARSAASTQRGGAGLGNPSRAHGPHPCRSHKAAHEAACKRPGHVRHSG